MLLPAKVRLRGMLCHIGLRVSMFSWISNPVRIVWVRLLNESAYSGCAHLPRLLDYFFKQTAILTGKLDIQISRVGLWAHLWRNA
jgi:hypothetical protein